MQSSIEQTPHAPTPAPPTMPWLVCMNTLDSLSLGWSFSLILLCSSAVSSTFSYACFLFSWLTHSFKTYFWTHTYCDILKTKLDSTPGSVKPTIGFTLCSLSMVAYPWWNFNLSFLLSWLCFCVSQCVPLSNTQVRNSPGLSQPPTDMQILTETNWCSLHHIVCPSLCSVLTCLGHLAHPTLLIMMITIFLWSETSSGFSVATEWRS